MISNSRILAEIQARQKSALSQLEQLVLPDSLQQALEQLPSEHDEIVIGLLAEQLAPNFNYSELNESVQFQGFEWYYDGRSFPDVLGYYGRDCDPDSDLSNTIVGSNSSEARDDFDIGVQPEHYLCGDCGYFDINLVCKPLYDFICEEGEHFQPMDEEQFEEFDEASEALINIYTLRLFELLHAAMQRVIDQKQINFTNMKLPFYVFANNHDWSPFLIYSIHDGSS